MSTALDASVFSGIVQNIDAEKVSVHDAARFLRCDHSDVLEGIRNGTIPSMSYGNEPIIPRRAFLEWVNRRASQKSVSQI